jgi:transcriptional regulator with XRE-family HTH domain
MGMDGLGTRLRARAQELELSDSEVARRLGVSQSRYANYVSDKREPDYRTLLRICGILGTTPNALLGADDGPADATERARLAQRIDAAAAAMDTKMLRIAASVMDTMASAQDAVDTHSSVSTGRKKARSHTAGPKRGGIAKRDGQRRGPR